MWLDCSVQGTIFLICFRGLLTYNTQIMGCSSPPKQPLTSAEMLCGGCTPSNQGLQPQKNLSLLHFISVIPALPMPTAKCPQTLYYPPSASPRPQIPPAQGWTVAVWSALFSSCFLSHQKATPILCSGFPYPPCSKSHLLLGAHTASFPTEPLSHSRSSSAAAAAIQSL